MKMIVKLYPYQHGNVIVTTMKKQELMFCLEIYLSQKMMDGTLSDNSANKSYMKSLCICHSDNNELSAKAV
jgi:hypothetical protein